ncbi:MAG: DUF1501 domain-containing protein [Thermoleophilia bacterium]|nr:DUF1501 domain-containing protein [Thermoleophilia bacterium]
MARCCTDFSRTDLLRRAAAEAGRGLPAIEAGMPLHAGTGLDRRSFLVKTAGLALAVYGGSSLLPRAFDEGIAAAAAAGPQKVLVSVFLDGGADSLSMLFPNGDPLYRKLRPRLALPASAGVPFAEDDRLRWHPSLASLAQLHGEGKVAVMPGVGYSGPDQSHFTSRHFWEVGATSEQLRTGWLGRYLDRSGSPDNPLQGLSLDWRLQPSLATARMPVASIDGPDEYGFWARNVWGEVETRMLDAIGALGALPTNGDDALEQATSAARQSARLREQLLPFTPKDGKPGYTSPVAYPKSDDEFPRRLAGLAAMLGAGLPVRVVALSAPGMYDTHDDQPQELTDGLRLTADSLLAFQRDLEARGLADRVVVHVWSEFGRRAKENGSNGTDHGAAGAGFLIGSRVNGTMIGEFPGLAKLDEQGNLRATSDYRGLYSALLEQWLGADADAIIPGARKFARPKVIR